MIRRTRPPKPNGIRKVITATGDQINIVVGREMSQASEVGNADFTELVYANRRRKVFLIPILEHASKLVLGWAVAERGVTSPSLEAWDRATDTLGNSYSNTPRNLERLNESVKTFLD